MRSSLIRKSITALAALIMIATLAFPVMADHLVKAEISCAGIYAPGDTVALQINLQNRTLNPVTMDVVVKAAVPGIGDRVLGQGSVALGPDQSRAFNRSVPLPAGAPNGAYVVTITGTTPIETSVDTCSFHVQ